MRLSIVVVMYNMRREAERTLLTLSTAYQQRVSDDDYEVIVVDNGSQPPLEPAFVEGFGENVRLLTIAAARASPVEAINRGVAQAKGDAVAIMVDGARMLSPGVLCWTLAALRLFERCAIAIPSWHLGPDIQNRSVRLGYDQAIEDRLLGSVDWRGDGYRLFDLSERLDPSSEGAAWFGACSESNFVVCARATFAELGGYEARFTSPGGGACNLDFFKRLVEDAGCPVVSLVGEATFHQVHGGVSTNIDEAAHPWPAIAAEYRAIRGCDWSLPDYDAILFGTLSPPAKRLLARGPNIFACGQGGPGRTRFRSWVQILMRTLARALTHRGRLKGRGNAARSSREM